MSSREKSPYYGSLQQVVNSLFADLTEEEALPIWPAALARARCAGSM